MCFPKAPKIPLDQQPTQKLQNQLTKFQAKETKYADNHVNQLSPAAHLPASVLPPGWSAPAAPSNPYSAKVDSIQGVLDQRSAAEATAKAVAEQQANFPIQMQQQQMDFANQINAQNQQSQAALGDLQRQLQEQQQTQLEKLKINAVSAQVGPGAGMRGPTAAFGGQPGGRGGVRARARGASLRIGSGTSAPGVGTNLGV